MTFISGQFHKRCRNHQWLKSVWKLHIQNFIQISQGQWVNKPVLEHIRAWHETGNKTSPYPNRIPVYWHICITRPPWVNSLAPGGFELNIWWVVFNVILPICEIALRWISLDLADDTVYPKKYAHSFCFAVLCCGYTLTDFPISIRLTSLALWQSNDCPSASKATLMNMDKYFMWIHYERLHNHNKAKHNKTVCIFLGIYYKSMICVLFVSRSFLFIVGTLGCLSIGTH